MNNVYVNRKKQEQKDKRNKMILSGGAIGVVAIVAVLGVTVAVRNKAAASDDSYMSVSEMDTIESALGTQEEQQIYEQVKGALNKMAKESDSDAIKGLISEDLVEKISQSTTAYVLQQLANSEIDTSMIEDAIYKSMYDQLVKEVYAQADKAVDSAIASSEYIDQITNYVLKQVNSTVKSAASGSGLTESQVQSMINSSTSQIREQLELAMKEYMASIKDTDTVTTAEMRTYISQYLDTVKKGDKGEKGLTGEAGKDGKTPTRGVDYYTDEDVAKMVNQIAERIEADGNISLSRTLTAEDKNAIAEIVKAALTQNGYATTDELIQMILSNNSDYLTQIVNSINKMNGQMITSTYDASSRTVTFTVKDTSGTVQNNNGIPASSPSGAENTDTGKGSESSN